MSLHIFLYFCVLFAHKSYKKHCFENKMTRLALIILIMCVASVARGQHITVMAFNCENAFDTIHDEGKNDYEYVAGGSRNWNIGRMYRKLDGIAKVIAAVDSVQPVAIVALCEVENDSVLEYLTKRTPLRHMGYDYIVTKSADLRGVDVAILYSRFVFVPFRIESLRSREISSPTRDILHVTGVARDDTLDVYSIHLPSKLGGKAGQEKSRRVAHLLKSSIDSVLVSRQDAKVIVMGDFNAELSSKVMSGDLAIKKYWSSKERGKASLYDVIEGKQGRNFGSYKYRGVWSVIDHIVVTGSVDVESSGVLNNPALLEDDNNYGGKKPKRTFVGYKYNGGISDHLPVWARIGL